MTNQSDLSPLSDVCLLLRAHAEHRWLSHEVIPVLHEVEQRDSIAEEQLGAALAYLEVLWIEAAQRAAETDAACAELGGARAGRDGGLRGKALSYHEAVCALRDSVARQVAELIAIPSDAFTNRHASL